MRIDKLLPTIRTAFFLLLLGGSGVACDDGKIYPPKTEAATGGKATMHVRFSGQTAWPAEYMLLFAAFGEDEDMPVISKVISRPASASEKVSLTLNGLDEHTRQITITVANKSRQPLYHFYAYPVEDTTREITLPVEEIDLATYDRIQHQVFNNYCTACHGTGEHPAAGLSLMEDKSYASLVNVPAPLSPTSKMLVKPGLTSQSFLIDVLTDDMLNYNHTDVLPEEELITLLKTWIDNGAQNKDNL